MNNDFSPRRGQGLNPRRPQNNWQRPATFRTPEQVSAQEELTPDTSSVEPLLDKPGKPPKKSFKDKLKSLTKKQWAIIIAVAVILLGGVGFGLHQILKDDPKPVKSVAKKETPPPAPEPLTSTLTGLPIADASVNDRPVTGIMIENSQDARPQSGLSQAGVVFEAVAEGGITRFLTLWQDTEPDYIGPVRSVRPYYVQWALGFDASIAHVGGSGDALRLIKDTGAKDLDQFYNTAPYWRVSNRYAPHNMYTSLPKLRELEAKKGFGKSNYTGFARKKDAASAAPTARNIDFNISGAIYNPHYVYDAPTNSYKRSEGGAPHMDEKSGTQLSPKVVVGLILPQGANGIYTTYNTIGSGTVYIFQDGVVTEGTWSKSDNKSNFTFKDAAGAELKLNPGQTWVTVLGGANRISYTP